MRAQIFESLLTLQFDSIHRSSANRYEPLTKRPHSYDLRVQVPPANAKSLPSPPQNMASSGRKRGAQGQSKKSSLSLAHRPKHVSTAPARPKKLAAPAHRPKIVPPAPAPKLLSVDNNAAMSGHMSPAPVKPAHPKHIFQGEAHPPDTQSYIYSDDDSHESEQANTVSPGCAWNTTSCADHVTGRRDGSRIRGNNEVRIGRDRDQAPKGEQT